MIREQREIPVIKISMRVFILHLGTTTFNCLGLETCPSPSVFTTAQPNLVQRKMANKTTEKKSKPLGHRARADDGRNELQEVGIRNFHKRENELAMAGYWATLSWTADDPKGKENDDDDDDISQSEKTGPLLLGRWRLPLYYYYYR